MKKILFFVFAFSISSTLLCQEMDTVSYKRSSWFKRNMFFSWGLSALFFDMFKGPSTTVQDTTFFDNTYYYPKPDTNFVTKKYNMWGYCIATAVVTTRINLINYKDERSVSLSIPLCISFGGAEADLTTIDEKGNTMKSHFSDDVWGMYYKIPVILNYNTGYHATYNNTDHSGMSYGVGMQATIIPIADKLTGKWKNTKTTWLQPVVNIAFKSDKLKLKKGVEFNMGLLNGWNFRITSIYTIGY